MVGGSGGSASSVTIAGGLAVFTAVPGGAGGAGDAPGGHKLSFLIYHHTKLSTFINFYYPIRNPNTSMVLRYNCSSVISRLSVYIWCEKPSKNIL